MLRTLEAEGRVAEHGEKVTLAKWSGWGASGVAQVFDEQRTEHARDRDRLHDLLGEQEYAAARRTTINAHYTGPAYAAGMWAAVGRLGFTGGEVLEPGCGAGTFIGLAPDDAHMTGVELDPTTAAIASHIYPEATIRPESFVDTRPPAGHFDLTIGNVPFADVSPYDQTHNARGHSLHNYFIIKSLRLTRPGGLVAVLTSSHTLDARNPAARREMNELGDLVGALRLPTGSHERASGTQAVMDLVILRRREDGTEPAERGWEVSQSAELDGGRAPINSYFLDNPDHVLGEMSVGTGMYGAETLRVTATAGRSTESAFSARLYAITDRAERAGLMMSTPAGTPEVERAAWVPETSAQWDGHIDRTPDGFTIVSDGVPIPYAVPGVEGGGVKRRSQAEEVESLLELRDCARQVLELEAANREDTDELAEARGQLRASYERYVDRFGAINRFTESTSSRSNSAGDPVVIRRAPAAVVKFRKDPFFPLVAALEVFDEQTRQGSPAA
ncbi:MAG: hypothetical protein ACTMKU_08320, partial [Actinomycetaceae bacterium]